MAAAPTLPRAMSLASGAGAVTMAILAASRWDQLTLVDRVAYWLDAATYAAAAPALRRRHALGWWLLYLSTMLQPVFAALEAGRPATPLVGPLGRTAGAGVVATALVALRPKMTWPVGS